MCTLTPVQILDDKELVEGMCRAGMEAVRINTAHLSGVEQLGQLAKTLKSIDPALHILIDTKGPEMRTTAIDGSPTLTLHEGQRLMVAGTDSDSPTTDRHIHVNYPGLHTHVKPEDTLLIDDGSLVLTVTALNGSTIDCRVSRGGTLGSRKGIAVAGRDIDLPAVNDHDRMYIGYAASSQWIDEVAHSFVRSADDVLAVKQAMLPGHKPVIAKIENQQGIDRLDEIIAVADGILIARGDLGASIGHEALPAAQATIAAATRRAGLPLYLATRILPSLMTGAEVSQADLDGIRLAIRQGVDVMLLTNETASGPRPLRSVETLHQAIKSVS